MLQAYCTVCSTHFSVSHGVKHCEGKTHIDLFRTKSQGNKMTSFFTSSKESECNNGGNIIFCNAGRAQCPFALTDHFMKLVKRMFPDSNTAKKYSQY